MVFFLEIKIKKKFHIVLFVLLGMSSSMVFRGIMFKDSYVILVVNYSMEGVLLQFEKFKRYVMIPVDYIPEVIEGAYGLCYTYCF